MLSLNNFQVSPPALSPALAARAAAHPQYRVPGSRLHWRIPPAEATNICSCPALHSSNYLQTQPELRSISREVEIRWNVTRYLYMCRYRWCMFCDGDRIGSSSPDILHTADSSFPELKCDCVTDCFALLLLGAQIISDAGLTKLVSDWSASENHQLSLVNPGLKKHYSMWIPRSCLILTFS